jgi:ribosomal protein S18 acetylase RimI-like enzyme
VGSGGTFEAMDFVLSLATPEDDAFLAKLFSDVHATEFAPLGLPEAALVQLLNMQFRGQRGGYAAQFPKAVDEILWIGPARAGRLLVNDGEDELRLVDIALLTPYRGQGVGGRVVQGLCERASTSGLPLRLSVRFGNPAERLYERLGFVRTGSDGINVAMEFCGPSRSRQIFAPEPATVEEKREEVEQDFTGEYFRTWTGRSVKARGVEGIEVNLLVEAVRMLNAPNGGAKVDIGDSFVVIFRGPVSPVLATACVEITPGTGNAMSIFLGPTGAGPEGIQYEAVFNRMRPRRSDPESDAS